MKIIQLKCEECGEEFERELKEYKRNKKLNRKIFCNRTCQAINGNKKRTSDFYREHCYDISQHSGCRQDEYSPFRPYLGKGRFSNIKHKMTLDVKYLKLLWEKQNGICPYTNIKMILPKNTKEYQKIKSLKKASLDRIDSSKGYVDGNVEFVCLAINLAKCNFTKEKMISFMNEIQQNTFSITQEQPT